MRPVLAALLLGSCALSHTRADGSADPVLDAGDAGSVALDGGRGDCGEYARLLCAWFDRCSPAWIWRLGSLEHCRAFYRGECEYESSLDAVGDFAGATIACLEERTGCEVGGGGACARAAGSRREGAPCRSDRQCGAGLRCSGTETSFSGGPVACDTGTCVAVLPEGATGCRDRGCDVDLVCVEIDGGTRCEVPVVPGEGEPCGPSDETCGDALYCTAEGTCAAQLPLGAPCGHAAPGPGFLGPCGENELFECDRETRTCVAKERAFVGDACGERGPVCGGPCAAGVCTTLFSAIGDACEAIGECGHYACVDGVCAPEPCD